jgi:hypothetical protein
MTRHTTTILANIGNKPGTTKRDALTIARRVIRITCQQRDKISGERRALRRQARKLLEHLPFTREQATTMERQAREHCAEQLEGIRMVLVAFGRLLLRDPDDIAAALGFDQVADLMGINPAHRERARREGGETLGGLVLIAKAEESATYHAAAMFHGGPLFRACQAAVFEFIRTAPPGLLPDPFQPGGLFGARQRTPLRAV